MPYFENDGIKIYYEIEGEGPPVIMIHGFASSIEGNWKTTNWIEELKSNYRIILLDCRGHGKSDKPHDESLYGQKMTEDVIKLMEHLSIEKANIFGYSMGAYITFRLLLTKHEHVISGILGGFVLNLMQGEKVRSANIESMKRRIEAFRAESIDHEALHAGKSLAIAGEGADGVVQTGFAELRQSPRASHQVGRFA